MDKGLRVGWWGQLQGRLFDHLSLRFADSYTVLRMEN